VEGLFGHLLLLFRWMLYKICSGVFGDSYDDFLYNQHTFLWILEEVFYAFVVAGITEEMCKYYTFRLVQHRMLSLGSAVWDGSNPKNGSRDDTSTISSKSYHVLSDGNTIDGLSGGKQQQQPSSQSAKERAYDFLASMNDGLQVDHAVDEAPRTCREKAMAITTGMISVAIGFACAEIFLLTFFLTGSDQQEQQQQGVWSFLLFRSLFPIHALAGALQSLNMIRRFVEDPAANRGLAERRRIGARLVIFPAVILHGTFNAILDSLTAVAEGRSAQQGSSSNIVLMNVATWLCLTAVMSAGIVWYSLQHRRQWKNLANFDTRASRGMLSGTSVVNSDGSSSSSDESESRRLSKPSPLKVEVIL